jgi:RNA polymerase sigma-70 factor (ECF subfamily)
MSPPPGHHRDDEADEVLARAAAGGDRAAMDLLLRRHQERVYRLCRRLCGNEADALDATQEALVTLARRIDRFDGRAAFTTWLYRVTTNACLDELRRRRRRPVTGRDEDVATSVPEPRPAVRPEDDPGELVAGRDRVDSALAQLTPAFRAPVVLRDVAGLDYAEIAELLDVPPGTVRSRIARGRGQLARLLGNQDGGGERPNAAGAGTLPTPARPTMPAPRADAPSTDPMGPRP